MHTSTLKSGRFFEVKVMAQFMFSHRKIGRFKKNGKANSCAELSNYDTRADRKNKQDLFSVGSVNLPSFAQGDPQKFWAAADRHERKNGLLARRLILSFPYSIPKQERELLIRKFLHKNCPGLPASFAVHDDPSADPQNPHCHILFSERIDDKIDRDPKTFFSRYNPKNPHLGGAKKAVFSMENKDWLIKSRESWACILNARLAPDKQVSHLKNSERGLPLPQLKIGQKVLAVERKGVRTRLMSRALNQPVQDNKIRCLSFINSSGKTITYQANRDRGDSVEMIGRVTKQKVLDMIKAIKSKGWTEIELTGSDEFKSAVRAELAKNGLVEKISGIENSNNLENSNGQNGRRLQGTSDRGIGQNERKDGDRTISKLVAPQNSKQSNPDNVERDRESSKAGSYQKITGTEIEDLGRGGEGGRGSENNFVDAGSVDPLNHNQPLQINNLTERVASFHSSSKIRFGKGYDSVHTSISISKTLKRDGFSQSQIRFAILTGDPQIVKNRENGRDVSDQLDKILAQACNQKLLNQHAQNSYTTPIF
jgi:MobA/MobL family/Large polyvalent protein-associated domain 7